MKKILMLLTAPRWKTLIAKPAYYISFIHRPLAGFSALNSDGVKPACFLKAL